MGSLKAKHDGRRLRCRAGAVFALLTFFVPLYTYTTLDTVSVDPRSRPTDRIRNQEQRLGTA